MGFNVASQCDISLKTFTIMPQSLAAPDDSSESGDRKRKATAAELDEEVEDEPDTSPPKTNKKKKKKNKKNRRPASVAIPDKHTHPAKDADDGDDPDEQAGGRNIMPPGRYAGSMAAHGAPYWKPISSPNGGPPLESCWQCCYCGHWYPESQFRYHQAGSHVWCRNCKYQGF